MIYDFARCQMPSCSVGMRTFPFTQSVFLESMSSKNDLLIAKKASSPTAFLISLSAIGERMVSSLKNIFAIWSAWKNPGWTGAPGTVMFGSTCLRSMDDRPLKVSAFLKKKSLASE